MPIRSVPTCCRSRLKQFFHRETDHYRIGKTVRERVTFSLHNVLRDPPFSRLDVVCCRNLLIYLDREAQRQLLETFHYSLLPNGILMLGASETADVADDLFMPLDKKNRLFRPIAGDRRTASPDVDRDRTRTAVALGRSRTGRFRGAKDCSPISTISWSTNTRRQAC